jgi:hypothetical protein
MFYSDYIDFPAGAATVASENGNTNISPAIFNYNNVTTGQALYKGAPVNSPLNNNGLAKWDDLDQVLWDQSTHTIWLSQKGVGDDNVMGDSVKYFNGLHLQWSLDGGAIFHSGHTTRLTLFEEVRDTSSQMRVPLDVSSDLLLQNITGGDFTWQFAQAWQFLATAGHEDWSTNHSYFPLHFADNTVGVGVDALLTKVVDGLQINTRLQLLEHQDYNFPTRDFSGWRASVGATYVFQD